MDLYHVLLFFHILALMAGVFASTLMHFAAVRLARAKTTPEARQWHSLMGRVAKVFPAVIVTFFATGSYMVANRWGWQAPFVATGATAAILLLVNGIITSLRSRALAMMLASGGEGALSEQAVALIHDPVMRTLPWVNLMIVFGTVFNMTVKPALVPSFTVLSIAIALGLVLANRLAPARAAASAHAVADRA